MDIATGIAVAFPRNPMHLAYQAWDLQKFSGGKFYLGIGSQVRAHIEKRFGVPFNPPASRMREYIQALKAISIAGKTALGCSLRASISAIP